jgi:hypothetical protein
MDLPVSLLKVRASWGEVGNVGAVPNYSYNTPMANDISDGNVSYIGTGLNNEIYGRYQQSIANLNLKWESTISSDFGIDLNLFNDKLTLSADYYDKNTSNLIDFMAVPTQAGIQQPPVGNIGSVTNKGFEFNAGYKQSFGKVQVSVYGNYSTNVNNVENLGANNVYPETTNVNSMYPLQSTVGQPWHSFYLIKTAGIFQTQDQINNYTWTDPTTGVKQLIEPHAKLGDLIFVDANHDGKITDADRQYMGSYAPKSTYGFGTTISWNGFDFNVFFQGVSGNKIFNSVKQMGLVGGTAPGGNLLSIAMDSWNYDKNSGIPRLGLIADNNGDYTTVSDFFLEDGSYLRLKNVSIGYTIPKRVLSKIGMSDTKFRFYVTGQNLLTFTKYSGLDPEVGNYGVDGGTYPIARVLSAGFNFTF